LSETSDIDTDKIDRAATLLDAVLEQLHSSNQAMHGAPDARKAAGTGADELSTGFLLGWRQMNGDDTVSLQAPTDRLSALTESLRGTSALFKSANDTATRDAIAARNAVEHHPQG
jgi:hypothetical protein